LEQKLFVKLINKALKGNKKAITKIIEMYSESVYGYILSLVKDKHIAEDLYQDVWIKVIKQLRQYDISKEFSPWLITVARNTVYDHFKKQKNQDFIQNEAIKEIETPEHLFLKKEAIMQLDKELAQLSWEYQQIIILRYFDDLSYDKIAEHLSIDSKAVKWKLHDAKKKLKVKLEGKEFRICQIK